MKSTASLPLIFLRLLTPCPLVPLGARQVAGVAVAAVLALAAFVASARTGPAQLLWSGPQASVVLRSQQQALEAQAAELDAQQQAVVQEKAELEQELAQPQRSEKEQAARAAAVQQSVRIHGIPWTEPMGTDIAFINTAQYPGSMKGAWHTERERMAEQAEEKRLRASRSAAHEPEPGAAASTSAPAARIPSRESAATEKAAMQLAVEEKVKLDAAKQEIAALKKQVAEGRSRQKTAPVDPDAIRSGSHDEMSARGHSKERAHAKRSQALRLTSRTKKVKPRQWRRAIPIVPAVAARPQRVHRDKFQWALRKFLEFDTPFHQPTLANKPVAGASAYKFPVSPGQQKSLFDYNLDSVAEPGEHVWPYKDGAAKGSPCAVPGACNHHDDGEDQFALQDDEFNAKRFEDRFKERNESEEDEPEAEEEEGEEPQEKIKLGDSELGSEFDDYVPPEDAYAHSLLTSAAYGIDHFAHLAPLSKDNINMMYGPWYHQVDRQLFSGHPLHTDGRGGLSATAVEDEAAAAEEDADQVFFHDKPVEHDKLGEDQLGEKQDEEVPVALTQPQMPGPNLDHFDHWSFEDPKNQQLLNGAYWKTLEKDGFTDRFTPASEAYKQLTAASHDRTLADTVGSIPHFYGFETAGGYTDARSKQQEEAGGNGVFTGTDESMEGGLGTHGSRTQYFKGKSSAKLSSHQDSSIRTSLPSLHRRVAGVLGKAQSQVQAVEGSAMRKGGKAIHRSVATGSKAPVSAAGM